MALDHHEAFTQGLARTVTGRADGESVLAALRRDFCAALEAQSPVAGFTGPAFARMIADSPTLTARLRELHDLREEALAAALAEIAPATDPGIAPRAAAALLAAAQRLLFQRIQELTLAGHSGEEITATLAPEAAHVFDLLTASLGDYPSPAAPGSRRVTPARTRASVRA